MNDLRIFNNEEFGEVRTAVINDEPMFCLADICRVLEIKNVSDCKSRLRQKGIVTTDTLTNGGKQKMILLTKVTFTRQSFRAAKKVQRDLQIGLQERCFRLSEKQAVMVCQRQQVVRYSY